MNEKKIRIGVLGCANIAKKLIIPNIINSEDFELSGVASRDQNKSMHLPISLDVNHLIVI